MTATWTAPGAGQWKRDDSHHTAVSSRYLAEVFLPAQLAGFAEGFRGLGAMLDGFDRQWVHGRPYMRPIIVGAPKLPIWGNNPPKTIKSPGKPPPRFVFKILFALHPELRRRARRAAETWEHQTWREMVATWHGKLRDTGAATNRELQRVDVEAIDDAVLADHLEQVTRVFREAVVQHFRQAPVIAVVVGDFMVRASGWAEATPNDVLAALRGASPASRAGAVECAKIAAAVATHPELRAILVSDRPPEEIVAALRAAPGAIGASTNAYLDAHGLRLVTGLELDSKPLVEMPEVIVRGIRAMLDAPPRAEVADPLAALRARTPDAHRAELEAAYTEAAAVYGVRDDDTGLLLWKLGLLRRAMRAAGRVLATRGAIHDAAHVIDGTPDEIVAALRGAPTKSLGDELRTRVARRAELDLDEPPVALGEAGPMPDPSCFPPAVARMQRAIWAFLGAFDSSRKAGDEPGVRGTAANGGICEGRARVVHGHGDFSRIEAGDILIARHTSPAYNVLLPLIGAIVTDRGGVLSHAAVVAREYGIPAIVDTRNATARIRDGSRIRVDGTTGIVEILDDRVGPVGSAAEGRRGLIDDRVGPVGSAAEGRRGLIDANVAAEPSRDVPAPRAEPARIVVEEPAGDGSIAALRDATAVDFGGKGRALAAAVAAGLPVPDGHALDADLVDRVVRGESAAIDRVTAACAALPAPWAVRSSAIGEDSAHASFAGQHETVLGVGAADLVSAIVRVHASAHSASALAYRAKMNVNGAPRMGVVVQTLLRPDVSGVLFSRDPTNATSNARVIEATWGLGEALVAGLVTPDRYRIGADGVVLERAIGDKDLAIEAQVAGGTAEVAVGAERARTACLDDARLAELSSLATRCEQLFGGPQDLEWAVANGRLHLLQSRPITR